MRVVHLIGTRGRAQLEMSYGLKKTTYKAVRGFQGLVGHYTKGQKLVAEAVEPKIAWGPETALMDRIAELTRDPAECGAILAMIWENIGRTTTKKWKLIYKNLLLLEHLLTYASPSCVRQIQDNVYRIRALSNYIYKDKNGNDQGVNVRKRSAAVADLATDEDLADVRRRAQENKERYRGMGSGKGGYSGGYGGYSSGGYSSSSSSYSKPAPRNQETFVEQPPPADLVARSAPAPAPAPAPMPAPAPAPVAPQPPVSAPAPAPAPFAQTGWGAPQQQQQQPQQPVDLWGAPQQAPPQPQPQQQALVDLFAPVSQPQAQAQRQQALPPMTSQPPQQQQQRDPLAGLFGPSPQAPARPLDRAPARSPLDSLFDM